MAAQDGGSRLGGSKGRARAWERDGSRTGQSWLWPQPCQDSVLNPGRGPGGARGRGQGSRRSSRWARAEAGREDDPRRVLQRCEMQHHHPWETGKASLASVKNSQSEQRRAGRTGSTGTVPAPQPAPAGLESPEGNRVQQEMKNGNAVCHAQGNNKKPAIVASQRPASHPELTGPDC